LPIANCQLPIANCFKPYPAIQVSGHGFSRAVNIQNDWALAPEIETQIGSVACGVSQNVWGIILWKCLRREASHRCVLLENPEF
jgi:hypothetical protein